MATKRNRKTKRRTKRRTRIRRGGGELTQDEKNKLFDALILDGDIRDLPEKFIKTHESIRYNIIQKDPKKLLTVDPYMEHFYDDFHDRIKPIYEKLETL